MAFRTFFDKSVLPFVSTNEVVMNEWKYFSRLISADLIDYNQVEFYLLLANKSQSQSFPQPSAQPEPNAELRNEPMKYGPAPMQTSSGKAVVDLERKSNNPSSAINLSKK
jgi:hypothetical protein